MKLSQYLISPFANPSPLGGGVSSSDVRIGSGVAHCEGEREVHTSRPGLAPMLSRMMIASRK